MAAVFPDEGLDYILGVIPAGGAPPTELYLGLFTSQSPATVPGRSAVLATESGVTEAAGPGYARVVVPAGSWGAPGAAPGQGRQRTADLAVFPPVDGGWGTVNGFFLATATIGGLAVLYANFDSGEAMVTGTGDVIIVAPSWRAA